MRWWDVQARSIGMKDKTKVNKGLPGLADGPEPTQAAEEAHPMKAKQAHEIVVSRTGNHMWLAVQQKLIQGGTAIPAQREPQKMHKVSAKDLRRCQGGWKCKLFAWKATWC